MSKASMTIQPLLMNTLFLSEDDEHFGVYRIIPGNRIVAISWPLDMHFGVIPRRKVWPKRSCNPLLLFLRPIPADGFDSATSYKSRARIGMALWTFSGSISSKTLTAPSAVLKQCHHHEPNGHHTRRCAEGSRPR
jgi:hypothetical protein